MHHDRDVELEAFIPSQHIEVMGDVLERGVKVVLADMPPLGGLLGRPAGPAPGVEPDLDGVLGAELPGPCRDGFEALVQGDVYEGSVGGVVSDVLLEDLEGEVEVVVAEGSGGEDAEVVLAGEGLADADWNVGSRGMGGGLGSRHIEKDPRSIGGFLCPVYVCWDAEGRRLIDPKDQSSVWVEVRVQGTELRVLLFPELALIGGLRGAQSFQVWFQIEKELLFMKGDVSSSMFDGIPQKQVVRCECFIRRVR